MQQQMQVSQLMFKSKIYMAVSGLAQAAFGSRKCCHRACDVFPVPTSALLHVIYNITSMQKTEQHTANMHEL